MPNRFFLKAFVLSCLLLTAVSVVCSQELPKLLVSQSIEREIKGGEAHLFTVQIGANQTARVEIEQKGVDVSLAAYKPSGERFIETESPSGLQGSDLILVTAVE